MKLAAGTLAAALAALAAAGPAGAQGGRGASITLFEQPGFSGRSRTFFEDVGNLNNTGFNDRAMSAQVRGTWRVCLDANMKGRCATLDRDVADLRQVGLGLAISSMQYAGFGGGPGGGRPPFPGGPGPGPGPGPGLAPGPGGPGGGQRLDGSSAVFFANPRGPGGRRAADEFCRRMGLGPAIYSDDRAQDLRDVLCSR